MTLVIFRDLRQSFLIHLSLIDLAPRMEKVLIIGALGQVGRELYEELEKRHGSGQVLATDIKEASDFKGNFQVLDCLDEQALRDLVISEKFTQVYHLAALLSATAEKHIDFAWKLSMDGLMNVLKLAKDGHIQKIFWPSSIAVFGQSTPKQNTPQSTIIEPGTVYGIGKLAGELWCSYYHEKFGVDVRSIRYPGLIGWKSLPGGGTTDYAVDIFYSALKNESFNCFLDKDTSLPMMHMEDAIRATIEIMEAPSDQVKIRTSYNVAAMSFNPEQISAEIKRHIPDFNIEYNPDYRQKIAEGWPQSIDDSSARADWKWKEKYDLSGLVEDMLKHIGERI